MYVIYRFPKDRLLRSKRRLFRLRKTVFWNAKGYLLENCIFYIWRYYIFYSFFESILNFIKSFDFSTKKANFAC